MPQDLIADRFQPRADLSWLDLATGWSVHVETRPCPAQWPELDEAYRRDAREHGTRLVDWGRLNATDWFEARTAEPVRPQFLEEDAAASVATAVAALTAPGVHSRAAAPAGDPVAVAAAVARRLRPLGIVAIRAATAPLDASRRALTHRHLALMVCDDDLGPAIEWMHALALVSTRTHVVIDLRASSIASVPDVNLPIARDRPLSGWRRESTPAPDPYAVRLRRALGAARRHRAREAERWARAALECARRHGSPAGQVHAARAVVEAQLARDEYVAATATARHVAERVQGCGAWVDAATTLAFVLVHRGTFAQAEALLTTAHTQAVLQHVSADGVRLCLGWLRFWQGRFEELAALVETSPLSAQGAVLSGLCGWATHDLLRLRRAAARLAGAGDAQPASALWSHTFTALAAGFASADDETRVASAGAMIVASVRVEDVHAVRLTRAFAADVLIAAGRFDDARRALGAAAEWRRASVVEQWLSEWLRAVADEPARARVLGRLRQVGALGIPRWGTGRETMQLAHAVPAVLQLVQDADDDVLALVRSCQWMRRTCGASGVAVLAAEDLSVMAADGWSATDTVTARLSPAGMAERCTTGGDAVALMTSPMRYAGVTIGWLVARGPSERAGTLRDLGRMLAALCAPVVQSRLDALSLSRRSVALTPEILGTSPSIVSLRECIARAAAAPFPVLIEGESGTGKELVARAIHRLGPRRGRRFSAVNCAALTDELVEAELFGHSRGAFTGAVNARVGLFEEASGGSLFLDECSELSPRAQAKLLRVLQEREVRRVGENVPRPVDVRILAATNQPLADAAARGAFRADLLFRLAVVQIRLVPLRERAEDIPVLARAFWRSLTVEAGRHVLLGPDALAALCRHAWPGNVREFQNVMAALLVVAPARGRVSARHVAQVMATSGDVPATVPLHRLRVEVEQRAIRVALARHGGRRAAAARELGITRQGLVKAIRRLKLAEPDAEGVA